MNKTILNSHTKKTTNPNTSPNFWRGIVLTPLLIYWLFVKPSKFASSIKKIHDTDLFLLVFLFFVFDYAVCSLFYGYGSYHFEPTYFFQPFDLYDPKHSYDFSLVSVLWNGMSGVIKTALDSFVCYLFFKVCRIKKISFSDSFKIVGSVYFLHILALFSPLLEGIYKHTIDFLALYVMAVMIYYVLCLDKVKSAISSVLVFFIYNCIPFVILFLFGCFPGLLFF